MLELPSTLEEISFDPEKERQALGIKPSGHRRGRPPKAELIHDNSVQSGLPVDWTRATFIVKVSLLEKLKDYAYTERLTVKEALDQALEQFLADKNDLLPHR